MDWLYILMPISGVSIFWPGLIILGLGVGIIGGFFGLGGAWMVTPGLNILGFPMAFAIGTDVAQMAVMANSAMLTTFWASQCSLVPLWAWKSAPRWLSGSKE